MLSISALAYLIATGLLLTSPTASVPLWTNTTSPSNTTLPAICRLSAAVLPCQTLYPSEYRVVNSRYPTYDQSPLHGQKEFFMLLRQRASTFQVASQVQFFTPNNSFNSSFPPNATCKLQIQLPAHDMQNTLGAEPIFNVYQVEREAGVPATWQTYERGHNESVGVFGQVNGTLAAQARAWNETGGLVEIEETKCNETLTWQMGMAFDGGDEVNYWDFVNVAPPFSPAQGFRVVVGC